MNLLWYLKNFFFPLKMLKVSKKKKKKKAPLEENASDVT